jgi:xanthine dehydrogenase accessory factor
MMPAAMSRRARQLAEQGESFVTATVVRAQPPTSVEAGNVALVLGDGTIEGFVGGACAEHSVRAYSLQAIQSGEALLLRILPPVLPEVGFGDEADAGPEGREVASEDGAVTVQNPCLSGGAIEIFLEPVLPAPRVLVVGDTPIAGAVLRLGAEVGLNAVAVDGDALDPRPGDLALVVASHGRDELHALRRGLDAGLPYVGLVASSKRGDGVIGELRGDGVSQELLGRIDVPAGLDIGARTPAEIALSILAKVVAVRRGEPAAAPAREATTVAPTASATTAVDPICGMTVAAVAGTPSVQHDGETIYFCCEGCKAKFELQHQHAAAD